MNKTLSDREQGTGNREQGTKFTGRVSLRRALCSYVAAQGLETPPFTFIRTSPYYPVVLGVSTIQLQYSYTITAAGRATRPSDRSLSAQSPPAVPMYEYLPLWSKRIKFDQRSLNEL
jgi:hypothetical protein